MQSCKRMAGWTVVAYISGVTRATGCGGWVRDKRVFAATGHFLRHELSMGCGRQIERK